jgi:flagellar hook protein FlgE
VTNSLEAGVSGMIAHQMRLNVVGNNIANANTVGFKSARALFSDSIYQLLEPASSPSANLGGTDPSSLGQGVNVAGIQTNFGQGSLQGTGRSTDVAVEGEGFLAVTDGSRISYTRNGALSIDAQGNLVHAASGLKVIAGLPIIGAAAPTITPASTLQLPIGQAGIARATSEVQLAGNLDSRIASGQTYDLSAHVFDSLGASHDVVLTFAKSATAGTWDVTGTSADGTVTFTGTPQVSFDTNGLPTGTSLPIQLALTNPNGALGALAMDVQLNNVTQLARDSSAALVSQDGLAPGSLTGVTINNDGSILGSYSNGLSDTVGQLFMANFTNPGGLESAGTSLYKSTTNSGNPVYGKPASNGLGGVHSGELESSNVDLAQEFADMIVTQRGFQASSRVVTASDQMLQELMNVIR